MLKWLRRKYRKWKGTPKSPKSFINALSEPAPSARLISEFSRAHVWLMIQSETLADKQPSEKEALDFIRSQARELGAKGKSGPFTMKPLLGSRDGNPFQPLFTSFAASEKYINLTRDLDRFIAYQLLFVKASVIAQAAFSQVPIIFDPGAPTERVFSEAEYRAFSSLMQGD